MLKLDLNEHGNNEQIIIPVFEKILYRGLYFVNTTNYERYTFLL